MLPQVSVALEITAIEKPIAVPYCGLIDSTPILCIQTSHIEIETPQGWRRAPLRRTFGVAGAQRQMGLREVSPGKTAFVVFNFSRGWFEVEPGQTLRVVLDAWPDEPSMMLHVDKFQLTSPPLKCPESGIGY